MTAGETSKGDDCGGCEQTTALVGKLVAGALPTPLKVQFRLREGEVCYHQTSGDVAAYLGADVEYTSAIAFGIGAVGAAVAAATLAGSAISRARAERAAAPQWRPVAEGEIYLTSKRLAVQHEHIWYSIWYDELMLAEREDDSVYFQRDSAPAIRVSTSEPDVLFVLIQWLAFNRLVRPPWSVPEPPYDTERFTAWRADKARRAGQEKDAQKNAKFKDKYSGKGSRRD